MEKCIIETFNLRYNGEYLEDKRHGFGTFEWKNGMKYTGLWKYGKQDGQGKLQRPGEEDKYGIWLNGKRI